MPDSTIFALGGTGGDAQPDSHLERSLSSFSAGNTWSALRGDASTSGDSEDNSSGTENTGVHNLEDNGSPFTNYEHNMTGTVELSFTAVYTTGVN